MKTKISKSKFHDAKHTAHCGCCGFFYPDLKEFEAASDGTGFHVWFCPTCKEMPVFNRMKNLITSLNDVRKVYHAASEKSIQDRDRLAEVEKKIAEAADGAKVAEGIKALSKLLGGDARGFMPPFFLHRPY